LECISHQKKGEIKLKLLDFKKREFIVLISLIVLLVCAAYFYMRFQQLKNIRASNAMTDISVAGKLIEVKNSIASSDASSKQKIAIDLKMNLSQLTLAGLINMGKIENLDSNSFEGLCSLIASVDELFPKSNAADVENQINLLINAKLRDIETAARNESISRASRFGDQHKCALKGTQVK
jgi:uncharacterized protein (UPF0333 family)